MTNPDNVNLNDTVILPLDDVWGVTYDPESDSFLETLIGPTPNETPEEFRQRIVEMVSSRLDSLS